jgi:hypothetical protein
MGIRDMLFHLDTSEVAQSVCDFAVSLAEVTGAHLTAAGVVIDIPRSAADIGGVTRGANFSSAQVCAEIFDCGRKAAETAYGRSACPRRSQCPDRTCNHSGISGDRPR